MDQRGIFASIDAVFGLVIVIIFMSALTHVNMVHQNTYSQETGFSNEAQDVMEMMARYKGNDSGDTILYQITYQLKSNNDEYHAIKSAGIIAGEFLNQTLNCNYNLTETKYFKGITIASRGNMDSAKNINSAFRVYGDYCFYLYIWQ